MACPSGRRFKVSNLMSQGLKVMDCLSVIFGPDFFSDQETYPLWYPPAHMPGLA